MSEPRDPYEVLGVARDAGEAAIKAAYRALARKHHPDVNPGDPEAEERFKEASAAFELLSAPDKRKLFDEFGWDGVRQGFDPEQARSWRQWQERASASGGAAGPREAWGVDLDDLLRDLGSVGGGGPTAEGRRACGDRTCAPR